MRPPLPSEHPRNGPSTDGDAIFIIQIEAHFVKIDGGVKIDIFEEAILHDLADQPSRTPSVLRGDY
jgi:hypothetical protein